MTKRLEEFLACVTLKRLGGGLSLGNFLFMVIELDMGLIPLKIRVMW
jgi:hypothetical protein